MSLSLFFIFSFFFLIFKLASFNNLSYTPPKQEMGSFFKETKGENVLMDGHYLVKSSVVKESSIGFPYNDPRRLLLFDGYLFSMKMVDNLVVLVKNGGYEKEVMYLKVIIRNCYFSCFERLDSTILKSLDSNLNESFENNGVDDMKKCFCDVSKLGADVFSKLLIFYGEGPFSQKISIYHGIWVKFHEDLFLKADKMKVTTM